MIGKNKARIGQILLPRIGQFFVMNYLINSS